MPAIININCENSLMEISKQVNNLTLENLTSTLTKLKKYASSNCADKKYSNKLSVLINKINKLFKYQHVHFQWADLHMEENLHTFILLLDQLSEITFAKAVIADILFIFNTQPINTPNLLNDYLHLFLNYAEHYKNYPNKFLDTYNQIEFYFTNFNNLNSGNKIESNSISNYLSVYRVLSCVLDSLPKNEKRKHTLQNLLYDKIFNLVGNNKSNFFSKFLTLKFNDRSDEAIAACRKLSHWCEETSVDPLPFKEEMSNGRYNIKINAAHHVSLDSLAPLIDTTYQHAYRIFNVTLNEKDNIALHIFANKTHFSKHAPAFGFLSTSAGQTIINDNICRIAIYLQYKDINSSIFLNAPHEWLHCLLGRKNVTSRMGDINRLPAAVRESIPEFIQNGLPTYYSAEKQLSFKNWTYGAIPLNAIRVYSKMDKAEKNNFLYKLLHQKETDPGNYLIATLLAAYLVGDKKYPEILLCAKSQDVDRDLCINNFSAKYSNDFVQFLNKLATDDNNFPEKNHENDTLIHANLHLDRLGLGFASGMTYGLVKALFDVGKIHKPEWQTRWIKREFCRITQILINSVIQATYVFSLNYPDRLGIHDAENNGFIISTAAYFFTGLGIEFIVHLSDCCNNKKLRDILSYFFLIYPWIMLIFFENELLEKFYTLLLSTLGNLFGYFGVKKLYDCLVQPKHHYLQRPDVEPLLDEDFLDIKDLIQHTLKRFQLFNAKNDDISEYEKKLYEMLKCRNRYQARQKLMYLKEKLSGNNILYSPEIHKSLNVWFVNIEQRFLILQQKKDRHSLNYLSTSFKAELKGMLKQLWLEYETLIDALIKNNYSLTNDFLQGLNSLDTLFYDGMLIIHFEGYLDYIDLADIRIILQPEKESPKRTSEKETKNDQERSDAAKNDLQAILSALLNTLQLLQDHSTSLEKEQARKMVLTTTRQFLKNINILCARLKTDQVNDQATEQVNGQVITLQPSSNNSRFSIFNPFRKSRIYDEPPRERIYDTPQNGRWSSLKNF